MKELLNLLFEFRSLNRQQAREALINISLQRYNTSEIVAFMSAYQMRSVTIEELAGFRDAMLELSLPLNFEQQDILDIVGTGGDGKNTFNISTLACFVAAAAGCKVAKHGNYGVSSVSGSSNVLEAIGYRFTNDPVILQDQLGETGLCFLHAPLFHPSMKSVATQRRELGLRTFFNILGPLVNPAQPGNIVLGVYNLEMARLYNYILQGTDKNYSIVYSFDGYDEVSLTSDVKLITRSSERSLSPAELGFNTFRQSDLLGGTTIRESAALFMDVLRGAGTEAQNAVACANAAVAMKCVHEDRSFDECVARSFDALLSKKAFDIYKRLTEKRYEYSG
jgi:anthranilate phosphoribosyltransferase